MISRAPKQLGDFGEGLVNYVLIKKKHEVAYVDHVGADLISTFKNQRFAISVKTRFFKSGSKESKMFTIEDSHIEKLEEFSKLFGMKSIFSLVVCLSDIKKIYVIIIPVNLIRGNLKKNKNGYSIRFNEKDIISYRKNKSFDISEWENEMIKDWEFI
ncbi:MAG: hypothetical protein WCK67_08640 [bacterium]